MLSPRIIYASIYDKTRTTYVVSDSLVNVSRSFCKFFFSFLNNIESVTSACQWMLLLPVHVNGCSCYQCMSMDAPVTSACQWMPLLPVHVNGCSCYQCMSMDAPVRNAPDIQRDCKLW